MRQSFIAQRRIKRAKRHQRSLPVGHVVRRIILRGSAARGLLGRSGGEIDQRLCLDLARAFSGSIVAEGDLAGAVMQRREPRLESAAQPALQRLAGLPDRHWVRCRQLLGEIGLARQNKQFAAHQVIERRVIQHGSNRLPDCLAPVLCRLAFQHADEVLHDEALQGLIAGERIVIMRGKENEVCL